MSKHSENFDDENDDPTTDDFDEYEDSEPIFCNLFVTRDQIEALLCKGQVEIFPIEEECKDCSSEILIFPTLILKD